jgi:hypothetical protein
MKCDEQHMWALFYKNTFGRPRRLALEAGPAQLNILFDCNYRALFLRDIARMGDRCLARLVAGAAIG